MKIVCMILNIVYCNILSNEDCNIFLVGSSVIIGRRVCLTHNSLLPMYPQRPFMTLEEKFTETLLNYFQHRINGKHINCERLIRRSKKRFGSQLSLESLNTIFEEMLFSVFEITQCTEYEIVREALQKFMVRKLKDGDELASDNISTTFTYRYSSDDLDLPNCLFNDGQKFPTDFLYTPILVLDFKATTRLLRFGTRFDFCPIQTMHGLSMLVACLRLVHMPLHFEDVQSNIAETCHAYKTVQRRFYFMLLVLIVTLRTMKEALFPDCHDSVKSMKLLFKAIKEPFVTVAEISRFLNMWFKGENNKRKIKQICSRVVSEFPESEEPLAPRSLLHLSRCEVRKCMGEAKKLPNGVWGLKLPNMLKNYILMQTKSEEFYPKFASELIKRNRSLHHLGDSRSKRKRHD